VTDAADAIESAEATVAVESEAPAMGAGLRSAAVYAVCGALPRAMGLITLPIYTHVVAPAEYGTFSLLVTISAAVAIFFSFGLDVAVIRMYFQLAHEPQRQQRFIDSVWLVLIVVPLAAAAVIAVCAAPFLSNARFDAFDLALALVGAATAVAATTVPFSLLRAEQRLKDFIVVTTVATVTNTGLALLFVAGFKWGVRGWLVAAIIANLATFATAYFVVPFRLAHPVDRELIDESLRFGLPLVPHSLAYWALQVADRIVIAGIVTASALGVYSLASNLGAPVLMLVQSLNYGFMPAYARAGVDPHARGKLDELVVLQAALVSFICLACALLAPPFVERVTPASYGQAAPLIPWIALGYGFLGLYMIPMNGISLGGGRTKFVSVATLSACAVNIALLYIFVPSGGIKAAAIASALGYAALLVAVFIYAWRPENPVRYRRGRLAVVFGGVAVAYIGARLSTADSGGIPSLVERSLWILAATPVFLAVRGGSRPQVGVYSRARS
jgi:O-antigen/teichoic acid export membrane protein